VTSSEIPPPAAPASLGAPASADGSGPAQTPASAPQPVATTARIAQQVAALDKVADLPLSQHAEMYQRLHAELQDALADIDGP
jgi:hypothetical protein